MGAHALAAALRDGALPQLEELIFGDNAFSDAARGAIAAVCRARGIVCKRDRFSDALLDEQVVRRTA